MQTNWCKSYLKLIYLQLVGEEIIAKKGLTGLYRDFVDYCDQEICEVYHNSFIFLSLIG